MVSSSFDMRTMTDRAASRTMRNRGIAAFASENDSMR
jgi:hypothetical protein